MTVAKRMVSVADVAWKVKAIRMKSRFRGARISGQMGFETNQAFGFFLVEFRITRRLSMSRRYRRKRSRFHRLRRR